MTMTNFINSQVMLHGQVYVDNMFDSNFVPVLTDHGWRWLLVDNDNYADWYKNHCLESREIMT
jgi:hypothetical protein